MNTLESIVAEIGNLPAALGSRRLAATLFSDRAYLALSPCGRPELFIRGTKSSFSGTRYSRALAWGEYEIAGTNEPLPALVVQTAATDHGRRIMAHVAYEARRCLKNNPLISNVELIDNLRAFFDLALHDLTLTAEEQIGLIGELQFLHELVDDFAHNSAERAEAVRSWCGPDRSLRDFHNLGISVEVKASSTGTRHHVSMDQLDLAHGEGVLILCSVMVRRDSSAALKLSDKVVQVERALIEAATISLFRAKLEQYGGVGYRAEDKRLYELEPGFYVERTTLRRIDESTPILRASSFRPGEPPANISEIRYAIEVNTIQTLSSDLRNRLLAGLVGRKTVLE